MPYSMSNPPTRAKSLPTGALKIYIAAFNASYKKYGEDRAHAIAWAAVKNKYKKSGEKWVAKADEKICDVEMMDFTLLDSQAVRLTPNGYLVANPRIARSGIQIYNGWEVGRPELDEVRVYRPEEEVFSESALHSLAWRPVTLDHPPEDVNSENWKQYAVGQSTEPVARDGEFVRVPLMLMDAAAIREVQGGKAQLSVGYAAKLVWEDGEVGGETYHAKQTEIRANHIAVVGAARGGDQLRVGDDDPSEEYDDSVYFDREFSTAQRKEAASKGQAMPHGGFPIKNEQDLKNAIRAIGRAKNRAAAIRHIKKRARALGLTKLIPEGWGDSKGNDRQDRRDTMTERTINLDGVSVELTDKDAQILERHLQTLKATTADVQGKLTASDTKIGELTAQLAEQKKVVDTKDGEITALKKQLADAQITDEKIDEMVDIKLDVVERAMRTMGDKYSPRGKSNAAIKREVVTQLLSADAIKGWNDDQVHGAFYSLTNLKDGKGRPNGIDRVADSFSGQRGDSTSDAAREAYTKRNETLANAWKQAKSS